MKRCPTCNKVVEWKENSFRPFCSERCQLIDFGAWVNEEYAVPAQESAPSSEELIHDPRVPDPPDPQ